MALDAIKARMETPSSKRELFERVRTRWPQELHLPKAQPVLPAIMTEPSDVATYRKIEDSLPAEDEWTNLAAWAFHQALNKLVRRRHNASESVVFIKDVSFRSFDTQMKSNLADISWNAERAIYLTLPQT
jgi:hypothetical protein